MIDDFDILISDRHSKKEKLRLSKIFVKSTEENLDLLVASKMTIN